VKDSMDCQCSTLAEAFSAFRALERFFLGVDVPMISKMILPPECLVTNVTCVWSFISMSSLVYQKVVRFGKPSLTELADELLLRSVRSSS